MTVTYAKLSTPISPAKRETLGRLYSVVGSMPVILLGAFARDLLFDLIHGIAVPRATMDIDTCVQMASWDDFNSACTQLKAKGFKNDNLDHPEKFTDTNGQEVDLLPFGSLSEDGKTITWPVDDSPWTVAGIQEAHDHALLVQHDGLCMRIIPPCAMVYLKMIATYDRPDDRRKKDSADIHFVLEHYLAVSQSDRLRSTGTDCDIMEKVGGNLSLATARIAGRDIGATVSASTAELLSEILRIETESGSRCPIVHQLAKFHHGQFQKARILLKSLRNGFDERRLH
jgi:predicted nucleotidyltransferase